jgi:uncharacterized membrane protein YdfJ with MMPL/SSD domain
VATRAEAHGGWGDRIFGRLGRGIAKHPWYPIIFWIVVFVATIPFLGLLGSVTTNSATNLPASAPSAVASTQLALAFPNSSSGSSSLLLFVAPNVTTPSGQATIRNVTNGLATDRSLTEIESITSVYSAAAGYLGGQAQLVGGALWSAINGANGSTPILSGVNSSATLLWGPPAAYVANWLALVNASHGTPSAQNYPAYQATEKQLAGSAPALQVLATFYNGVSTSNPGFNATAMCWSVPSVVSCSNGVAQRTEATLIPVVEPTPALRVVPTQVLATLAIGNYTAWLPIRFTTATILNVTAGAPTLFVGTVWTQFPHGPPSAAAATDWATSITNTTPLWSLPLPIPLAVTQPLLNAAHTATIVEVDYAVGDSTTNASGGNPVFSDVQHINSLVPGLVANSDPSRSITFYQTGPAALDETENSVLEATLAIILPITVLVLLTITGLYFRSPLTPAVAFAGIGMALVLGLGGTVLIGTLVTHVDSTALTLEETFVLGVGTDYSIFLIARYREELVRGRSRPEAVATSLTWAGQSVATSGSTAIIATLALAFSGVALLSQWGMVLSLAILLTVLISLTFIPAVLTLLGPRIFWPNTGERFRRHAAQTAERNRTESTYFYRVGRLTQRRPRTVVGAILLVSVPLILIALTVPISYDFYQQLPSNQPASVGLNQLGQTFGQGYAFPSFVLVRFDAPLFVNSTSVNAAEFGQVAQITTLLGPPTTGGVSLVESMVGPYGAPLGTWQNFSALPPVPQTNLRAVAESYIGVDGRSVFFGVQTAASGLSNGAISTVAALQTTLNNYVGGHPDIAAVYYGGGAPTTRDLANQTFTATERMILAVTIGLIIVLLVVLRSGIIPIMAVATIGLSISWAWALTYLVLDVGLALPLFFYVPTILFILILGLGIDYNIFLLTRVREERLRGRSTSEATVEAVGRTGGIITAAAIILASAFAVLSLGEFTLLRAIGFAVAIAIVLDAMIVRTFLVPAAMHLMGDRVWGFFGRGAKGLPAPTAPAPGTAPTPEPPAPAPVEAN